MAKRHISSKIILSLLCVHILSLSLVVTKVEEELCPLQSDNSQPSCEGSKTIEKNSFESDDLEIVDETGSETVSELEKKPNLEVYKPSDSNLKNKIEYMSEKGRKWKKPAGQKIVYPEKAKYEDVFLRKGHEHPEYLNSFTKESNYTNYFDFALDEEEISYVKSQLMVNYPTKKFQKNNQGNFLHFYKTALEKSLPVMFTVDSMLYSLNENIYRIQSSFFENVYVLAFKKFLENLVFYCEKLKENLSLEQHKLMISQAQIFYGAGIKLLSAGISEFEGPQDTDSFMSGMAGAARQFQTNNFNIMMKVRPLMTQSMNPQGIWRRNKRLANIFSTLKWYNLVKFDLRTDLRAVYILGKIIVDSENDKIYQELLEMNKYFNGEDRHTPNPAQVYQLGRALGISADVYEISDEQLDILNRRITQLVEARKEYTPDLSFLNDMYFFSREEFEKYRHQNDDTTSLFGGFNSLEAWATNKLIDVKEQGPKLITSTWEMMDVMHHAGAYREWVINRYKSKKTVENERFMPFRDNIDIEQNFEKAKYSVKRSMEKEPQNWKQNLKKYYHYLLYKLTRKIKHSNDPLYNSHIMKESNFYTALGAYIHHKRQILLLTYRVSDKFYISGSNSHETKKEKTKEEQMYEELVELDDENDKEEKKEDIDLKEREELMKKKEKLLMTNARIPEVVIEPHLEFYKEVQEFWNIYRNKVGQFINTCEYFMQLNYETVSSDFQKIFQKMSYALDLIIKGIKLQETGKMDESSRVELNNLINYNVDSQTWSGWYTDLHETQNLFNYDIWMMNLGNFAPAEDIKFDGYKLFNTLRFPFFTIAVVEDPYEKVKKLVLMPKYNSYEFYLPFEVKADVEKLTKHIVDRE